MTIMHSTPPINLYSDDVARSVELYRAFGFTDSFRWPGDGTLCTWS